MGHLHQVPADVLLHFILAYLPIDQLQKFVAVAMLQRAWAKLQDRKALIPTLNAVLQTTTGVTVEQVRYARAAATKVLYRVRDRRALHVRQRAGVLRLVHMAELTQSYLRKFLADRTLSAKDLTEFYYAYEAKAACKTADAELLAELKQLMDAPG